MNGARRTVLWSMIGQNPIRASKSEWFLFSYLSARLPPFVLALALVWAKCAHAWQESQIRAHKKKSTTHTPFFCFDGVTHFLKGIKGFVFPLHFSPSLLSISSTPLYPHAFDNHCSHPLSRDYISIHTQHSLFASYQASRIIHIQTCVESLAFTTSPAMPMPSANALSSSPRSKLAFDCFSSTVPCTLLFATCLTS